MKKKRRAVVGTVPKTSNDAAADSRKSALIGCGMIAPIHS